MSRLSLADELMNDLAGAPNPDASLADALMADLGASPSTPSPTVLGMPGDAAFYRPELGRQLQPGEPGYEVGAAQIEAQRRRAAEATPEYPMPASPLEAAQMVGRAITEPDTLSRLGQGLNAGRLGYSGGVADVIGTAAGLVGADQTADAFHLAGQQLGQDGLEARGSAAGQLGAMAFDMVPAGVMLAASGAKTAGVRMAGQAVPLGVMGGSAAGQGIQDYRQTAIANGQEPNPWVEAAVGAGYGAAEMLFERFAIGKTGEAIRGIGQGIAEGILRRDVAQVAKIALGVAESAGVNAGEEWATQVAQNLISKTYDPQRDPLEGATEAGIAGGLQGLAFTGGGVIGGIRDVVQQNRIAGLEQRIQRGRGLAAEKITPFPGTVGGGPSLADELMSDITRGVNPDIGATPPPIPQGGSAPTRAQQIASEAEARLRARRQSGSEAQSPSDAEAQTAFPAASFPTGLEQDTGSGLTTDEATAGTPESLARASPRSGESAPSPASTRQEAASGPVLTGPSGAWDQSITAPPSEPWYIPKGVTPTEAPAPTRRAFADAYNTGQSAPRAENQSEPAPALPAKPSPLSQENANALREEEGRQGREGLLSPPSEPNQSAAATAPTDYSNVATIRLRQMAKKAGLDSKGSREEVIARLTSQAPSSANSSASSPEATIATSSSSAAAGDRHTSLETPGPSLSAQQVSEPPSTSSASQSSTSRANQTLVPSPNDTRSQGQTVDPAARSSSGEGDIIAAAAVRDPSTGRVYEGATHAHAYEQAPGDSSALEEGFVTTAGRFVPRNEALGSVASPEPGMADVVFMVKPYGMTKDGTEAKVRQFIAAQGGTILQEWRGTVDGRRISSHYRGSLGKPFAPAMIRYFTGREVVALRVRVRKEQVSELRKLIGPSSIQPGTLRGDLVGQDEWQQAYREAGVVDNALHLSESAEEGAREVGVWFGPPEIKSESPTAQSVHRRLWATLSAVAPGLRFGGSNYNGLAVPGEPDDLDYVVPADDIDATIAEIRRRLPTTTVESTSSIDPRSGTRYAKLEYPFENGKADIAVVSAEAYRGFVHPNAIALFMPRGWKDNVVYLKGVARRAMNEAEKKYGKDSNERKKAKAEYNRVKTRAYIQTARRFDVVDRELNATGYTIRENIPSPPSAMIEKRLGEIEAAYGSEARAQAEAAIKSMSDRVRGHVLFYGMQYELPAIPAKLKARLGDVRTSAPYITSRLAPRIRDVGPTVQSVIDEARGRGVEPVIKPDLDGRLTAMPADRFRTPAFGWRDALVQFEDGTSVSVTTPELFALRYIGKGDEILSLMDAVNALVNDPELGQLAKDFAEELHVASAELYWEGIEARRGEEKPNSVSLVTDLPEATTLLGGKGGKSGASRRTVPQELSATTGTSAAPSATSQNVAKGDRLGGSSMQESIGAPPPAGDPILEGEGAPNAGQNSERRGDQLPGNGERGDVRGEDPGLGGDADAVAARGVDGRDAGAGAGQPGSQRGGDGGIEQPAAGASGVAEPQPRAEGTDAAGGGSDRGTAGIEDAARADEPVDLAKAKAKADPNSIPVNSRNHVIEPGEEVAAKSNTAKFKANIEAIKLLRTLEREDRQATPDEKKVLARYTGWGWGGTIFDESKGEHAKKREQMREVMSEAEYAAARASITNAHYTAQNVVRPMWEMAKRLGFTGGRVLEPGAGIGNFLGMVPADVRDATEFVPVELDQLSGKMLKKLYPQADVRVEGFEETRLADNSFDLAIGNVPFSADVKPAGKDYRDLMLHDYFFARALDKVKPGGLVAMISTDGTLQKQADGKRVRGLFASKADLVGAIRLPNNAFEENAGTEVTTDILIFRKKDGRPFDGASFIQVRQLGTYDAADIRKTLERRASRLSERYNSDELSFEQYQRMQNDVEQQLAELDRHGDQLPLYVNEYFIDHPEMALGQHTLAGTMYRPGDYALTAKRGQDTIALLNAAIESLPADIMGKAVRVEDVSGRVQLEGTERIGSYIFRAGEGSEFFQVEQGTIKPADWLREKLSGNDWQEAIDETTRQKRIAIARSWMGVREAARKLHALEISTAATDRQLNAARRGLNEQYDAFVKEHGTLNHPTMESRNPAGFLMADPDFYLVQALEVQKQVPLDAKSTSRKTGKVVKGRKPTKREEELGYKMEWVKHPIFEKRQNQPTVQPTKADSVEDAVAISLGYHNRIDTGIIGELLGVTEQEATKQVLASGLAFKDPKQGILLPRATYLSGNVREKLREARESAAADAAYTPNVKALEAVQPPDVPVERIFMSLSSRFIPDDVTSAFASEFFGTEIETKYVRATNAFDVNLVGSPTAKLTDTFAIRYDGQEVMGGLDLLRHALDGTQPIARIYVGWGKDRKQITLKEETHKAQQLVKQMHDSFRSWAKTTKATVERAGEGRVPVPKAIENQYNEQFNGVIPVDYDGSYLKLPGLNNQVVRRLPHRMSVVARILADRCAVMAHGVGSGKTYSQIVAAMELRRLGLARKPMIVVHKSTVGDFARSFRTAYPGARLLVANEKTFAAKNRKRLMAQVALGDWDAVIVTQPQFELLQNDPARLVEYINGKVSELREALEAQKKSDGRKGGKTASQKRIEQQIKAYENKLKGLMDDLAKRTERGVYFQELGVDFLLVDEAHAYKKAPISTRKQGVKGIPSGFSMRALNTKIKALSTQEKRGDGTGVVFATGTPITNTMAEAYVMLDLATPNVLREYNIHNFDEFADTFGATETNVEFNWAHQFRVTTRFKKFENGQQLMSMIRAGFDVKMGNKELGLVVPEVEGGEGGQLMIVPSTPAYDQASEFLLDAANIFEELEPKERREASWVPISVMQAGMAAALDPRIINPEAEDDPRSKVNVTADLVSQWLEESKEIKGTVFVFADRFGSQDTSKLRGFVGGVSFEEAGAALDQDVTIDADAEEDPEKDAQEEEEKAATKAEDKAYRSGGFNLYKDLKAKLVARGVPAEQIAIINDYESADAKQQLFDKMKAGVVRVLIGSTDRLGTGVNAQDRVVGAIHMDPPRSFTPAGREQRQGRYIRQGNLFATPTIDGKPNPHYIPGFKIKEVFLGMEKSGDTTAYQLLANKQKFIVQLLLGRSKLDSFDDPADEVLLSIQQQKALLTGDDRVVRQAELVKEVQDLKMEKGAWENAVAERNRRLESLRSSINYARATGPRLEREAQRAENLANPKEVHIEGNKLLTDPEEIREALKEQVWKVLAERLDTKAELAPEKTFIMDGRPWMVKVTQETKGEAEEEKLENGGIITKIVDKVVRSFVVSEAYVKDGISVKAAQPATFFNGLRRMSEKLREQARRNQESLERTTKELAQLEAEPDPTFEKAEQLANMEAELASIERALAETKNTANVKRTSQGLYRGQPFLLRGQEGKIRYVAEDKAGKLTDLRVTFQGRVHNVMSQHQDPLGFILEATKAWSDREMERKQHTPTVMRKGEAPSGRLTAVQARIRQYMGAAQSRMERRARERGATLFANPFLSPAFYADMADTALLAAMKALDLGITGGKKLAGVVQEIINTHRPELMERQEDVRRVAKKMLKVANGDPDAVERIAQVVREHPPRTKAGQRQAEKAAQEARGEAARSIVPEPDKPAVSLRRALLGQLRGEARAAARVQAQAAVEIRRSIVRAYKAGTRAERKRGMAKLQEQAKRLRMMGQVEARGAKAEGREQVQRKMDEHEAFRQQAIDYAKTFPKEVRGAMVARLSKATTQRQLERAVRALQRELARYTTREDWRWIEKNVTERKLGKAAGMTESRRKFLMWARDQAHAAYEASKDPSTPLGRLQILAADAETYRNQIAMEIEAGRAWAKKTLGKRRLTAAKIAHAVATTAAGKNAPIDTKGELRDPVRSWLTRRWQGARDLRNAIAEIEGPDGNLERVLWDRLERGEEVYHSIVRDQQKALDAIVKRAGFKSTADAYDAMSGLSGAGVVNIIEATFSGKTVKIPLGDALGLIAHATDPQTLQLIADPDSNQMFQPDLGKHIEGIYPTPADIDDLRKQIDPTGKYERMIGEMKQLFESMTRDTQHVYRNLHGYEFVQVPGRWPRPRNIQHNSMTQELPESAGQAVYSFIENNGMYETRRQTTGVPILMRDPITTALDQIEQSAKMIGLAVPVRDAANVLLSRQMRETITTRFGKHYYEALKRQLMAISRANQQTDSFVGQLNAAAASTSLAINLSTWAYNAMATIRMLPYLGVKDWTHAMLTMHKVSLNTMFKSGYFHDRYHASASDRFSGVAPVGFGQTLSSGIVRDLKKAYRNLLSRDSASAMKNLRRAAGATMGVMNFFDSLSGRTAWAAFEAKANRHKPNWTPQQREQWVGRKARRLMRETQNGGSPLDMSLDPTAARGTAVSFFTLFTSDTFKTRNRIVRAYGQSKTMGTKVLASELVAWYLGFKLGQLAWTSVSAAIAAALGWDDEDRERLARTVLSPQDDGWKAAQMFASLLSPIMGQELVSALEAMLGRFKGRGDVISTPTLDLVNAPINSFIQAVDRTEKWASDEGNARQALMAWAKLASDATAAAGLNPLQPILRRVFREVHEAEK